MYVNKIPFFITISRFLKFGTAVLIADQKHETLIAVTRDVCNIYKKRGFILQTVLMDGQFEGITGGLAGFGITVNTVARGEHVPEAERYIRTIKERARCVYNTMAFKKIPGRMVAELIYYCVFWLNTFPARDGVSKILSPRAIVTGSHIDYNKHCKLEYGAYVQVHEEHDHSMITRTTGAIALRPTGNTQGGYYFYSLATGKLLNRRNWTLLPIPQDVIDRVHTMARRAAANVALTFGDRFGEIIPDNDDDDDDDGDYIPNDEDTDDDEYPFDEADDAPDDDPDDIAGVMGYLPEGEDAIENDENENNENEDENEEGAAIENNENEEGAPIENNGNEDSDEENDENKIEENENENEDNAEIGNIDVDQDTAAPLDPEDEIDTENEVEASADEIMDQLYGPRNTSHGLRPRKARDYGHMDTNVSDPTEDTWTGGGLLNTPCGIGTKVTEPNNHEQSVHDYLRSMKTHRSHKPRMPRKPRDYDHVHATLAHTVMTQMSMKKGIKEFGYAGVDAVLAELQQLYDRDVLEPQSADEMTRDEKHAALNYLMFLKKKRCGRIKGRGCADGRKQRIHTKKEDASSPTVAIEAVMLSCVIDAEERRHVAFLDIPGAFMQANMDELVHMRLEGKMAELFVRIDPS